VGQDFSCALSYDGEASCWGANYYGQLGTRFAPGIAPCPRALDLVSSCAKLPVKVGAHRFTDLDAGLKHVCAVGTDGTVWCWGRNEAGQLGGETSATCSPNPKARGMEEFASSACSYEPVQVEGLPPARLVAAGDDFSCAVTAEEGAIHCWGGSAGATPRLVSDEVRFLTISAGYTNLCAQGNDTRVACWSLYGGVSEAKWLTVAEGLVRPETHSHSCALGAETNRAYCWGFNADGSLGKGSHSPRENTEIPVPVAGDRKYVRVAVSFLGTCAMGASIGDLYCWGSAPATPQPDRCASGGEFGGSHECALTPQAVFPGRSFSSITIAVSHACGRAPTANVYCWGSNNFGEVGNGTTDRAMDAPQLVGVQTPAGRMSKLLRIPSGRSMVLVGIVGLLAFLVIRILRAPS
jgi:alpha-tubulin suppressor-like RCC1 family protein